MSIQLSKTKSALLVVAVIVSNIAVMGEFATFPVIDALYEQFPTQTFWVDTWLSINQWTIIIFSILGAALLRKMSKKTMLIIGGIIFTLAGGLGAVENSIVLMVIIRAMYGVGVAFVNVASIAVVAEVYVDEDKMNRVMGLYNALQGAIGAAISWLGGIVAVGGWTHPFKLMWLGIPMVIMFVLFVPSIKPEEVNETELSETGNKDKLGVVFWLTTIAFILFASAYAVPSQYVSSYVIENGIGNEALAGTLGSIGTIGSFIFCLGYDRMFKAVNQKVIVIWYMMAALLIAVMYFVQIKSMCYILFFIVGGSMSIACTYTYSVIPQICPENRVDDGIGIMTAACCVGYAISPYFTTIIQNMLGTEDITPTFIYAAAIALVAGVIEIIITRKNIFE